MSTPPPILIVDDSRVQRIALAATLRQAGFEVREAVTGDEALRQARAGQIGLILLDVVLPDVAGYEVCRRLKADPATALIPVVLLSALGSESKERVHGLDCGADGYLAKPADAAELLAQVRALLRARQAEEALRQSEAQYRVLAESIPHLVWVQGPDGESLYCNRRCLEYVGLPAGQAERWDWRQLVYPDDLPRLVEAWECCRHAAESCEAEYRARRADGAYRWHILRAVPLHGPEGQITRWFTTSTDIDGQKRAEEALREEDRRKDEFLAVLAHELRNPLAPLRNSLEVLRLPGCDAEAMRRAREMMERQVGQMARLIDDLLDVSRIGEGKIRLHTEWLDLASALGVAVETSRPLIEASHHGLTVALPAAPLMLQADAVRLAQVVANLLNNAAKYTPPGGKIHLSAGREGNDVVIRVRDNGLGIPAAMLSRIFDLFTQVDRTRERAQGGLGIGLTLVRKLVEMHGGTVAAHSAGPGQGSEFIVRLPAPELRLAPPTGDGTAALSRPTPSRRVLIVDDQPDAAESLAILLRLAGHEVRLASDGQAALEMAPAFRPDVVLLDIGLPRMDGYEVARRLRQQPGMQNAWLVALTGYGGEEDRRQAEEAGFDVHLVKPAEPQALQPFLARTRSER